MATPEGPSISNKNNALDRRTTASTASDSKDLSKDVANPESRSQWQNGKWKDGALPHHGARFCDVRGQWLMAVAADSDLKLSEVRVLVWLANKYADHRTGVCWPSQETLREELALNLKTIKRALGRLESLGWLAVERGQGRTHHSKYTLSLSKLGPNIIPFKKGGLCVRAKDKRGSSDPEKGVCVSNKRGSADPPNLNNKPNQNSACAPPPGLILEQDDAQARHWGKWMHHEGFGAFDSLPQLKGDGETQRRVPKRWPPEGSNDDRTAAISFLAAHGVFAEKGRALA